jgi:hypothetical protein
MADTIVNAPQPQQPQQSDGSAGWAVAIIILLAVIVVGGYFLIHRRGVAPSAPNPAATVQVNIPGGSVSPGGGTTGGNQ